MVGAALWFLAHNTLENMRARGIQSGFGFLSQPAGFDIGESVIPYDALDPYWKAFVVGVLNTLRVAIVGIVLATVWGTPGIGRFSCNAIVRGLCYAYVGLPQHPGAATAAALVPALHRRAAACGEPISVGGLFT